MRKVIDPKPIIGEGSESAEELENFGQDSF